MKQIILTALLVLSTFCLKSQEAADWTGNWKGSLVDGKKSILFFMVISNTDSAGYSIKMEVPEQGIKDIKPVDISVEKEALSFAVKGFRSKYKGVIKENKVIDGVWFQSGKEFVLKFEKTEGELVLKRPQNPVA
jgi:hypothetical protein